jgi:hypothetical protein
MVLHDNVLEPFLVKLKQHLELIQVCLGEIESWLLEPKSNIQFLEETFGKKLKTLPYIPIGDDCLSPYSKLEEVRGIPRLTVCPICNYRLGEHSPCYYSGGSYKFSCLDRRGFFKKSCTVLEVYRQSGKFETEFNIANTIDQKKLKKFIEFMGN